MKRLQAAGAVLLLALSYVMSPGASSPVAAAATAAVLPPGGLVPSVPGYGGVDGSFAVTDDGAATYSVPLWVPEGRRGSQPKLSLSYSSRAGNGSLGVGWKLDGLSSITACPRTRAIEGYTEKLFYDGSDGLCLGGDRLLPIGTGSAPQRDYVTERAMFARITAFGMQDNLPDYFQIWAKDGTILTFGASGGSRMDLLRLHANPSGHIEPESSMRWPAAWAVNQIEDRDGNTTTVEYAGTAADGSFGDLRPTAIHYEPNRTVQFFYENRTDPIDGYAGGLHTGVSSRMNRILMSGGPAGGAARPLREYRLAYDNTSSTARSRLRTVTECDGDAVCKTPLTFDWSAGSNTFVPIDLPITDTGTSTNGHGGNRILPIDIDGDGRDDLLYTDRDNNWKLRRSTGLGFGAATDAGIARAGTDTEALIKLADFDLDGRTDAMAEVPDSSKGGTGWRLFRSDGAKFVPEPDNIGFFGNDDDLPDQAHFLDLNGDGYPDFLTAADERKDDAPGLIDGPWRYRLNRGTDSGGRWAPEKLGELGATFYPQNSTKLRVVDSDGDGRSELVGPNAAGDPRSFGLSLVGVAEGTQTFINGDDSLAGDFNGDGLTDGKFEVRVAAPTWLQTNTGNGQGKISDGTFGAGRVADFNGDGRDDVLLLPGCVRDCQGTLWQWGANFSTTVDVGDAINGNGFSAAQPLDVDGDGVLDMVTVQDFADNNQPFLRINRHIGGAADRLVAVNPGSGIGPRIEVQYATLADRSVHTPCSAVVRPTACPASGGVVVSMHRIATGDPAAAWDTYNHTYAGARTDLDGRGWLGFAQHSVKRLLTGAVTDTFFDNTTQDTQRRTYPFAQLPKRISTTVQVDEFLYDRTETTIAYQTRPVGLGYLVAPFSSETVQSERFGTVQPFATLRRTLTSYDYDGFGNATTIATAVDGGRSSTTTRAYDNLTGPWLIGELRDERITSCTAGGQCENRRTTFDYYPNGNPRATVIEPDRPELSLATTVVYGPAGTVASSTVADSAALARTTTYDYDADRLHPRVTSDALGHASTTDYDDSGLGVAIRTGGFNAGEATTMRYDGFGRLREINHADGSFEHITHSGGAAQTVTRTDAGGGLTSTVTDALGRTGQQITRTFDGQLATTYTKYDPLGQVASVSRPSIGAPQFLTTYEYDPSGRLLSERAPDGARTWHTYTGLRTNNFDAKNTLSWTVATPDGDVSTSCQDDPAAADPLCTTFGYDAFGNTSAITAPDGSAQVMSYDVRSRRTKLADPSLGTVTLHYNAFGEPSDQTNALGQTTTYTHDVLGRTTKVESPDGRTSFTWDTSADGVGKLASANSTDSVFTRYQYDEFSHPSIVSWKIEGEGFEVRTGYDTIGRVASVTYPHVFLPVGYKRLRADYAYNASGYLSQVKDGGGGPVYWTAQQRDAAGQLTREAQGNGVVTDYAYRPETGQLDTATTTGPGAVKLGEIAYTYDANRNVTVRNDRVNARYETYGYDTLDRLTRWQAGPTATSTVLTSDYRYDRMGNLTSEAIARTGQAAQTIGYQYGYQRPELKAPPNALVQRDGVNYTYDPAGRQLDGPNRHIAYNTVDLPKTVDTNNGRHEQFAYDAAGTRVLKRETGVLTTITAGPYFERRRETVNSETHNFNNIIVNGQIVAQVEMTQATPGGDITATGVQYLHSDRQNSTTLVTNSAGRPYGGADSIFNNLFYDPWGRRVDDDYGQVPNNRTDGPRQLYTGQYHDDEIFLINMGGRIYDPHARRFLTADPVMADPLNGQDHNRYAYVRDNPTSHTDPTGHLITDGGGAGDRVFFCCGADAWNDAMDWLDAGGLDDLSPLDAPLITQAPTMASMTSVGNGAGGGANELSEDAGVCGPEDQNTCELESEGVDTQPNSSPAPDADSADDLDVDQADDDDDAEDCTGCVIGAKGGKQNIRDTGLRDFTPEQIQEMYEQATGVEKQKLKRELKALKVRHRAGADQNRPERPPVPVAAPDADGQQEQLGEDPGAGPDAKRIVETAGKAAAVTAGGLTLGGIIWWGLKALSPLCGPAAPACAVIL